MSGGDDFWTSTPPSNWPDPPARLSYSALKDIEGCPRRWSLRHANYADLWSGKGYPRRPSTPLLLGRVAHAAIERITRAIRKAGCTSYEDVVPVLRDLGGLSQIISACIAEEIERCHENPRAMERADGLEAELRRRGGDVRLIVQRALNRAVTESRMPIVSEGSYARRGPLGFGYHPEVELAPDGLAWVGYADAIHLAPDRCEIIDYKTGDPSPAHAEQLRIYALLWARDSLVNPSGRLATALRVAYSGAVVEIQAPTFAELAELEVAVEERARVARNAIARAMPPAVVTTQECRYCDVKHLCDDYWTPSGQSHVAEVPEPRYRSLQVIVVGRRGPSAVAMTIELDPHVPAGTETVGVLPGHAPHSAGQRLRLLDVQVTGDAETGSPVLGFAPASESFLVVQAEARH
jgi:hypothetical protein